MKSALWGAFADFAILDTAITATTVRDLLFCTLPSTATSTKMLLKSLSVSPAKFGESIQVACLQKMLPHKLLMPLQILSKKRGFPPAFLKKIFLLLSLASLAISMTSCASAPKNSLAIKKQGVFSSGGTVTEPIPGTYDETKNWLDQTRAGTTTHVDHANTFFQIPENENGFPMVFLHGYGQTRTGWQTDAKNVAAVIAVEPGFAPEIGSEEYKKFLDAKVPMLFLFGDYIENGPQDIQPTGFWKTVMEQCKNFAVQYVKDGGEASVVYLPDVAITGNSHFMFQELNNAEIADFVETWLKDHGLTK